MAALAGSAVAVSIGGVASAESAHAVNAGTLTLGGAFATASFNPWLAPAGDNEYLQVEGAVYDSLTHIAGNGRIEPGLATSWKYVNPKTLVLTLRTGVTFTDGKPVNAQAVAANFAYVKHASPAGQENAFIAALTTKVLSSTKLQVTSSTPDPNLPYDFATGGGFIVNPQALKHPATLATKPAGSGPYVLTSFTAGQQWNFTRRSHYWDQSEYPYSKLVIKSFASTQAEDDALLSGQIQGAPDTAQLAPDDSARGLRVERSTPLGFDAIWLSDRAGKIVPALGSALVREAMNYAIDRPLLIAAVDGQYGKPGSLVAPPGQPGYSASEDSFYTYDLSKAKQLLAQAGYGKGFTLPILSTPVADPLVEAVAGMLSKVGITLQISDHTTDFLSQLYSGNWAASVFAWTPEPMAQGLQELLSPDGLGNFNHSTNPTIEAMLAKVGKLTGAAQTAELGKLVDYVNQQAWFLIPGYNDNLYVTGPKTTCTLGQTPLCQLYSFRPVS
ncbi:MAG TPA: ABC transporter substrate-binding protein [Solirubrobacteraceae bacterium]|nr:ABC transporter substrate-binding protein [Solirubrobacteraceae bacterium]